MLLDIREVCPFADYFVICSADTSRQIEAVRDEIGSALSQQGIKPRHQEGAVDSGWLLMDFGEVIVHIFEPERRQYYGLDRQWSQAIPILRIQ